jgi:hypothetical protein
VRKIIGLILVSWFLTSCATYYSSTGEKRYLLSRNGSTLNVPPPLSRDNLSEFYTLPQQNQDPQINIEPPKAS